MPFWPVRNAAVVASTVPPLTMPSVPVFAVSVSVGASTFPLTVIVGAVRVAPEPAVALLTVRFAALVSDNVPVAA